MEDADDAVKGDVEDPHKYPNDEGDVEDADPPTTDQTWPPRQGSNP